MNDLERCQSCGIPLRNDRIRGTDKDGSMNMEFCSFCYKNGEFVEPNITIEEMVEKTSSILSSKSQLSQERAKEIMANSLPNLKRWNK